MKRSAVSFVLGGALLFAGCAPLFAQVVPVPEGSLPRAPIAPPEHPATPEQIREYFELAGVPKLLDQVMTQMLNGMRVTSKDTVPASVWDQMQTDFRKYDFLSVMIPAYQRYVSQEDMAVTLAYMRSDAARRMHSSEPFLESAISEATSKAGREIGEKAARDHMDEILALRKQKDAEAAARVNGTGAKPEIVLPPEGKK